MGTCHFLSSYPGVVLHILVWTFFLSMPVLLQLPVLPVSLAMLVYVYASEHVTVLGLVLPMGQCPAVDGPVHLLALHQ